MASGKVTKRTVDALRAGERDAFLWDDELRGFGVKVTPAGSVSYVYQFRLGGREARTRRYTIGAHGSPWTAASARAEAERLAKLVGQGIDPSAADAKRRRESVDLAFPVYAERFITEYLSAEWKGGFDLASGMLRREAVPAFRRKALPDITKSDVSVLMGHLADRPAARRNLFAILRRLFKWAVNNGDLGVSPMRDMDAPPAPGSRDRVLSDEEVACAWLAADTIGYPFGSMVKLLLLTGQRREEVSALEWAELDQGARLWTLPSERAKNRVVHDVPLSDSAVAVLDAIAKRKPRSDGKWPRRGYVFTSDGEQPVRGYSYAKQRMDKEFARVAAARAAERGELALAPDTVRWVFHDLRRTLATGLQRLGIRFEVTEAVLNHLSGAKSGVAGVYQRHDWKDEKRAALDAWAAHVAGVLNFASVSNVIPIAVARQ